MASKFALLLVCIGLVHCVRAFGSACTDPNEKWTNNYMPNCEPSCEQPDHGACMYLSHQSGCTCKDGFYRSNDWYKQCIPYEQCNLNPNPVPNPTPNPFPNPMPNPFNPIPNPFNPIPNPFNPIPNPFNPIPDPFNPTPNPFNPIPNPFNPTPNPFNPIPIPNPFNPTPNPFPLPDNNVIYPDPFNPSPDPYYPDNNVVYGRAKPRPRPLIATLGRH